MWFGYKKSGSVLVGYLGKKTEYPSGITRFFGYYPIFGYYPKIPVKFGYYPKIPEEFGYYPKKFG